MYGVSRGCAAAGGCGGRGLDGGPRLMAFVCNLLIVNDLVKMESCKNRNLELTLRHDVLSPAREASAALVTMF